MSISALFKLITLTASLLALLLGELALSADIVLREKVTPVKSVVSLGDIADIQATSIAERQRLALTPLWVAPPFGEQRFVTAQQVFDILVNRGYNPAEINMYGAPRVAIGWQTPAVVGGTDAKSSPTTTRNLPATNSMGFRVPVASSLPAPAEVPKRDPIFLSAVEREQLADQVREAVITYIEDHTGQLGLIDVDFALPQRHCDLLSLQTTEVTVSGGQSPWTGRQALTLDFESEKGPLKLALPVQVYDTTPVLVAKRAVARGQMLTAANVAIERPSRETRVPSGRALVYSLDEALGKEAGRAIRPGDVVTAEDCLAPQMVKRNAVVTIVSAGGGIVVRRQAKALTDARYGEVTEVQLLDSRERLVGRVVGQGELATLGSPLRQRTATGTRQTPIYR